ncbi:MAG TPA: SsrA-binding protein SmpB [Mollicutes bacterium]|nr:SsrA-binding protein SmpB [Mollicutes bacterium]
MIEIRNRQAHFNYEIVDTFEAGIVLKGTEIKSIRNGTANLTDSYAIVKNNELFLLNMHISQYKQGNIFNHQETRTRKLLMHKKEIIKLNNLLTTEGFTLIPLKLYFKRNKAKILLGLGKGKKIYDKRQTIKERDIAREMQKEHKEYYR